MQQEKKYSLEKFGVEIAKIHEKHTRKALKDFLAIDIPKNANEIAMSKYYKNCSLEDTISKICQNQIEGVLHDLFFLFEENEMIKMIVITDEGDELNLASEYEELRAKPLDWVEQYSAYGWEGGRQAKFYSDYYGLGLA